MYYRLAEKEDYPVLVELWEKSVRASHTFLNEQDLLAIKQELPTYFPQVTLKIWYDYDQLVGFSGTTEHHLEMLFLAPQHRQKGLGSQILQQLIEKDHIRSVDVNTQNEAGLHFYLKQGFLVTGESLLDGQGRPYPLTHLTLKK